MMYRKIKSLFLRAKILKVTMVLLALSLVMGCEEVSSVTKDVNSFVQDTYDEAVKLLGGTFASISQVPEVMKEDVESFLDTKGKALKFSDDARKSAKTQTEKETEAKAFFDSLMDVGAPQYNAPGTAKDNQPKKVDDYTKDDVEQHGFSMYSEAYIQMANEIFLMYALFDALENDITTFKGSDYAKYGIKYVVESLGLKESVVKVLLEHTFAGGIEFTLSEVVKTPPSATAANFSTFDKKYVAKVKVVKEGRTFNDNTIAFYSNSKNGDLKFMLQVNLGENAGYHRVISVDRANKAVQLITEDEFPGGKDQAGTVLFKPYTIHSVIKIVKGTSASIRTSQPVDFDGSTGDMTHGFATEGWTDTATAHVIQTEMTEIGDFVKIKIVEKRGAAGAKAAEIYMTKGVGTADNIVHKGSDMDTTKKATFDSDKRHDGTDAGSLEKIMEAMNTDIAADDMTKEIALVDDGHYRGGADEHMATAVPIDLHEVQQ